MTPSSSFRLLPKEVLWPFRFPWYRTQVTKALEKKKATGPGIISVVHSEESAAFSANKDRGDGRGGGVESRGE